MQIREQLKVALLEEKDEPLVKQSIEDIFTYRKGEWPAILRATIPAIQKVAGKQIVLVIGNTRSGKSTLINDLLLMPHNLSMEMIQNPVTGISELKLPNIPKGLVLAPMGKELAATSTTVYPESFAIDKDLLCDTPGFEDANGVEKKLMARMNIQLLTKLSKVKGIVIVIDFPSIEAIGGEGFKKLTRTLSALLSDPSEKDIFQSLLLVVTKRPELKITGLEQFINDAIKLKEREIEGLMPSKTLSTIKKLLGHLLDGNKTIHQAIQDDSTDSNRLRLAKLAARALLEKTLTSLKNDNSQPPEGIDDKKIQELNKELAVWYLFRQLIREKRVVIADPIKKESREKIKNYVTTFKQFSEKQFSSSNQETHIQRFQSVISGLIWKFTLVGSTFNHHCNNLSQKQEELKVHDERIRFLESQLNQNLSNEMAEKKCQEEIKRLQNLIDRKMLELNKKIEEIEKLKKERDSLDTDESVYLTNDIADEKRRSGWTGVFGYLGRTNKELKYNGVNFEGLNVPYSEIRLLAIEGPNTDGEFGKAKESPDKLTYSIPYRSFLGKDANAKINVYVQKRHKPSNVHRINQINNLLENEKEIEKTNLEAELTKYRRELLDQEKTLRDKENTKRLLKEELSTRIRERSKIVEAVKNLRTKKEWYQNHFHEDRYLMDCINMLTHQMDMGLDKENTLLKEYQKYYYQLIFEVRADKLRANKEQKNASSNGFFSRLRNNFMNTNQNPSADQPLRAKL
jgi:hypothetical protein